MQPYFAAMDMLVLPSLSEGLPNVVLESMAAGKAVVAANVGGVAEIVEHRRNGLLFPAEDEAALSTAISEILLNPALADTFASAGKKRVANYFSFEAQAERLIDIYHDVLARA
jgi:glycosyltransferase involved in cell wall biosynthesis